MKITGLHHIALIVDDMEKSLGFYQKLGGRVVETFPMMDNPEKMIHMLELIPGLVIELLPRGTKEPETNSRFPHIALAVDDVNSSYDEICAAGATPRTPPRVSEARKTANAFVFGPDNELIELFRAGL